MKSFNILLMLAMIMALATALSATTDEASLIDNPDGDTAIDPFRRAVRFLSHTSSRAAAKSCEKHPKICESEGSPGPFCCKKKCVDLKTDKFNCGRCGKKCNYSKICCGGKCVNPLSNLKHCGGCNNNCGKGNACMYGICNYA